MALSEAQKRAIEKYKREKTHRVPIVMRNEEYNQIKAAADAAGESVSGYFRKAAQLRIEFEMERENI